MCHFLWNDLTIASDCITVCFLYLLVIYGAIVPCTILYITAAMFAYMSFFNHTQAQLIQLYEFIQSDGNLILYCNMLVITCIIFSIPLAQYPARNTIWMLMHTLAPYKVPPVRTSVSNVAIRYSRRKAKLIAALQPIRA